MFFFWLGIAQLVFESFYFTNSKILKVNANQKKKKKTKQKREKKEEE